MKKVFAFILALETLSAVTASAAPLQVRLVDATCSRKHSDTINDVTDHSDATYKASIEITSPKSGALFVKIVPKGFYLFWNPTYQVTNAGLQASNVISGQDVRTNLTDEGQNVQDVAQGISIGKDQITLGTTETNIRDNFKYVRKMVTTCQLSSPMLIDIAKLNQSMQGR